MSFSSVVYAWCIYINWWRRTSHECLKTECRKSLKLSVQRLIIFFLLGVVGRLSLRQWGKLLQDITTDRHWFLGIGLLDNHVFRVLLPRADEDWMSLQSYYTCASLHIRFSPCASAFFLTPIIRHTASLLKSRSLKPCIWNIMWA